MVESRSSKAMVAARLPAGRVQIRPRCEGVSDVVRVRDAELEGPRILHWNEFKCGEAIERAQCGLHSIDSVPSTF
jgi:hypothetical protein